MEGTTKTILLVVIIAALILAPSLAGAHRWKKDRDDQHQQDNEQRASGRFWPLRRILGHRCALTVSPHLRRGLLLTGTSSGDAELLGCAEGRLRVTCQDCS
jgi:hypothetical protein